MSFLSHNTWSNLAVELNKDGVRLTEEQKATLEDHIKFELQCYTETTNGFFQQESHKIRDLSAIRALLKPYKRLDDDDKLQFSIV